MSRLRRAVVIGLVAAVALPLFPTAAHAETTAVAVDVGGWFWALQTSGTDPTGTVPIGRQVPDRASGVKDTANLPVAFKPGTPDSAREPGADPDKESYLIFDVYSAVPVGSTITRMVVSIGLAAGEEQVNLDTAKRSLIGCRPDSSVGPAEGEAFAAKPIDDCTKAVPGRFEGDAFHFDVTPFAQEWLDGDNYGIGIRNRLDQVEPFQIVLEDYAAATAVVEYTPADDPGPPAPPPLPPAPVDPGTGTPGFVPGPVVPPIVRPQPNPQPNPQPAPTRTTRAVQPIAARPAYRADLGLTPGAWLGLLFLAGLLAFVSLVLGDPQPARAAVARRRLDLRPTRGAHAGGSGLPRPRAV